MTLKELCLRLGKSETTMITSYNRTCENLAKKGIIITKTGKGQKAEYEIHYAFEEEEKCQSQKQ